MIEVIRKRLFELSDEKYRQFHLGLVPGTDNVLGVRLPLLRKLAQQLVKGNWREYLNSAPNDYYEEIMLQGLIIGYAQAELDDILNYAAAFVPKIDNWAICDTFCNSLKITKKHKSQVWQFLQPFLQSKSEFEVRFGVVMLLSFYIEDDFICQVLSCLDNLHHDGYYVKMAVAWALSICFVKYPHETMPLLQNNHLDTFTYNKALQKITESLRVDQPTKVLIRGMKRH